jgi:hypothetical protein
VVLRILAFAVALGLAPAFAQQPAAPRPAPAAAAPSLAPAPAPAPSTASPPPQQAGTPGTTIPASQFQAARDLVIASGMSRSFDDAIAGLSRQLAVTVTRTRPDLSADLNVVMQQLTPEFARQSETMIINAARIYASAMTEQDLKDATAFFNSPVGKRYVDFEPVIMTNVEDAMKQWSQGVSTGMMNRVREEMKKKGHDF